MMLKFGRADENVVGLDIGTYSIKAISLKNVPNDSILTAYNMKNITTGEGSVPIDQLIKDVLDEVDLQPERVNISLSGPDVIVRFITFPKMNKEQLENALKFEAEKYIPFDVNDVVLDFIILGDAPESGQMNVLLVAVKREPIDSIVKTIEKLKMSVNIIDIDPFAVFNAFNASNKALENEGCAFLDLGHTHTDVLITTGTVPCFMRQIQIAGKDISSSISKGLSVNPEVAEEYKRAPGDDVKSAVMEATESVLDELVNEIQLSFGYFENKHNKVIKNTYCSGGMIAQEGVIDYIGNKLGVKVNKWNPVDNVKIDEAISRSDINTVSSQLAVGIGLALRG